MNVRWVSVAVLSFAWIAGFQSVQVYRDRAASFEVRQFSRMSSSTEGLQPGSRKIEAEGKPLLAEWFAQGIKVRTHQLEAMVSEVANDRFQMDSATLTGDAQLVLDGAKIEPNNPQAIGLTEVNSQTIQVQRIGDGYRVTSPGPLDVKSVGQGTRVVRIDGQNREVPTRNETYLKGSKAEFTLDSESAAGQNPLRSGTIEGPVEVRLVRTDLNVQALQSTVKVTGNRLEMDLRASQPYLRLSGGLQIEGDDAAFNGVSNADTATIVLNERQAIVRVELSGSPIKTTLKRLPTRLGGR
jgi:hypothetical protein